MCRLAFIPEPEKINKKFLIQFFDFLISKTGGDGNGISGYIKGEPFVFKGVKTTTEQIVEEIYKHEFDNGVIFHTRRASVGNIIDEACHPYIKSNFILAHNGHIVSIPAIKLMMMERGELSLERAIKVTDSELLSEYIEKYGLEILKIFGDYGTVIVQDNTDVHVMNNYDFEYIKIGDIYIYASEFPHDLGKSVDEWKIFCHGTHAILKKDGMILKEGGFIDAKTWYGKKKKG